MACSRSHHRKNIYAEIVGIAMRLGRSSSRQSLRLMAKLLCSTLELARDLDTQMDWARFRYSLG